MRTLDVDVNYVAEMAVRPYVNVNDFSKNQLDLERRRVTLHNARNIEPSLWREGFCLMKQALPEIDFRDHQAVVADYLPAMQEVIAAATGADKVVMSDGPLVRHASPKIDGAVRPAGFAHTDYTESSAKALFALSYDRLSPGGSHAETAQIVADLFSPAAPSTRRYKRCLAVQTWRVLTDPPHDFPLAICAASSVSEADIVEADFRAEASDFEEEGLSFSLYRHNLAHRWWWYPDMRKDEVLVFVGYDFGNPAQSRTLHTAFADPNVPSDAPGRSSVEARSFVLFED